MSINQATCYGVVDATQKICKVDIYYVHRIIQGYIKYELLYRLSSKTLLPNYDSIKATQRAEKIDCSR